jgi:4-hydroxybenzoate polyprenyltransferase
MIRAVSNLVRLPNLLMIAATMCFTRYCLIGEMLNLQGLWLSQSDLDFTLLVLSVIFIAAAGYMINDYFDTKTDSVNKPDKVVVGREISRRQVMATHIVLNILGVILGFYLAYKSHFLQLGFINLLSVGLLWFYSTTYKRRFLIGNLVVAILAGVLPIIVLVFEPHSHYLSDDNAQGIYFVIGYAFFAFIISLIREIIKDMEDIEGDKADGCTTMSIVIGTKASKAIALFISLIVISLIAYIQYVQYVTKDFISFWYFLLAIQLPFILMFYKLIKAKGKSEFNQASFFAKIVMIGGILSMIVFYISLEA